MHRFVLLALTASLCFCTQICVEAAAQDAGPSPKSPAVVSLPVQLKECDVLSSSVSLCTTWQWTGTSYVARWQNGLVGVMKVELFNSCMIEIQREDYSSNGSGTYKGRWDGKKVVDGELIYGAPGIKTGIVRWTAERGLGGYVDMKKVPRYTFSDFMADTVKCYKLGDLAR